MDRRTEPGPADRGDTAMARATPNRLPGRAKTLLTALFVLSLGLLTFAAASAETPRSEYMPAIGTPG